MKRFLNLSLSSLMIFSAIPSRAEMPGMGAEESFFTEMPRVVSASLHEESTNDTPVVVNVFSREQIKRMGASTLNDLLPFVPGFLPMQDADEVNFGVRGLYGTTQQKTLIMRDGHPLYHMYLNNSDPGHDISLTGVEQVEIMRGPGGSLYGDMAQSAVINLISEKGRDVEGGKVDLAVGNFGQRQFDAVFGQGGADRDFLSYAHLYGVKGEVRDVPASGNFLPGAVATPGKVVIGGNTVPMARDLGIRGRSGSFTFTLMNAYSGYQSVRSNIDTRGALIYPDYYNASLGAKPGLTLSRTDAVASYDKTFNGGVSLKTDLSMDDMGISANYMTVSTFTAGSVTHYSFDVNERQYGVKSYLTVPMKVHDQPGTWLAGLQTVYHEIYNVGPYVGYNFLTNTYSITAPRLPTGNEIYYAAFGEYKQRFTDRFLLNAGARFDHVTRRSDKKINQVSPRVAFILDPNRDINIKLSYTRAFKDAAYWYRYNTVNGYSSTQAGGKTELLPEIVDSYQVSASHMAWQRLVNRLTGFYNSTSHVIYLNTAVTPTVAANSGSIKIDGLEYELEYKTPRFQAGATYTYTNLVSFTKSGYNVTNGQINNWPRHMGTLQAGMKPFESQSLWLQLSDRYVGQVQSPTAGNATFNGYNAKLKEGAVSVVDLKATWDDFLLKDVGIGLKVTNVFDRKYFMEGDLNIPTEQPGRWYLFDVSYKFR